MIRSGKEYDEFISFVEEEIHRTILRVYFEWWDIIQLKVL